MHEQQYYNWRFKRKGEDRGEYPKVGVKTHGLVLLIKVVDISIEDFYE